MATDPGSATVRAEVKFRSMSVPPMPWLSVMNWSGVMVPASSASRPYWIPTLSTGRFAKPSCGRVPQMATS